MPNADHELELMFRVQRDEPGAFAELVALYWAPVIGRFTRQVGDRQEAEDLAQDVFLRLYRSRKRYRPQSAVAAWIYCIARNVGKNALRRRARKGVTPVGLPSGPGEFPGFRDMTDAAPGPGRPVEQAELAVIVRGAVAALNRRQRQAVELRCADHSYTEIASALEMTPKAAKCLLYRARNELRVALLPYADA